MKNNASLVYALFLILGDFLALVAAFTTAYILRVKLDDRPLIQQIPAETYLYAFLIILPLWIAVHALIGLYHRNTYENRFREFGKIIVGSFLGILVVIGYDFVSNDEIFPARLVVVYALVLGFSFLLLFRSIARLLRSILFSFGSGLTNVLIIGSKSNARSGLIEELEHTKHSGYRIVGVVGDSTKFQEFDSFNEAIDSLPNTTIHTIVQTDLYRDGSKNDEIMSYAQNNHITYRFIPGNSELFIGNIEVELFRGTPVVTVHQTALVGWGRIVKRIFDIIVGIILLVVASPLLLLVALASKIQEPKGQILFRQVRLTQFDKPFTVYKFRSAKTMFNGMSPEEAFTAMGKPELAKVYRMSGDSIEDDPRFSGYGRFLRASSLDELPQLLNVIKGDISLIGPRALVPQELVNYPHKHHILSVRSGLTGLAQVSGRRDLSFEERRKLDAYYVQNWSFWLDIIILFKTIRAVLAGIGAK
jgi:exopolysaccharide biosynthesis polyprenyl glycosylphosphotransferase